MDDRQRLIRKYLDGACSAAELEEVYALMERGEHTAEWDAAWDADINRIERLAEARRLDHADLERIYDGISRRLTGGKLIPIGPGLRSRKRYGYRWVAAAAVILALAVGWLLSRAPDDEAIRLVQEIVPGGNRAELMLPDGAIVSLSEAQTGIIVGEGIVYVDGSAVLANGQQTTASEQANGKEGLASNISRLMSLTTPKGGTYQITLPDGTKVWLNAASTLKYPARFDGSERVVELTGEAYFDVAKLEVTRDTRVPFLVKTNSQTVEVLGTQFNISAYPDEPETKTTLVEGSVRVAPTTGRRQPATLIPGQQAILCGTRIDVDQVDPEAVSTWRMGRFNFDGKNLSQVMRELGRWYDIDVVYEGQVPEIEFFGGAHRNSSFSTVMNILETNGIAFRLAADRTLILSAVKKEK